MQTLRMELEITLDDVDERIMEIFSRYPSRWWKAHQIRSILEYEGVFISGPDLWNRMKALSFLSLVIREKRSRVYRYRSLRRDKES